MASRRDYRKENSKNTMYLIIGAIIVVLVIIGAFVGVQHHKAEQARIAAENKKQIAFNKTHFNPNVKIYGVNVGKMTVAKATAKIQSNAKNRVTVKNNKYTTSVDTNAKTISSSEVQNYFNKQHTQLTSTKKYNFTNKIVNSGKKRLGKLMNASVDYKVGGKTFTLDAKKYVTQASYYSDKIHFDNVKALTNKLDRMDDQVKTLGKSYKVKVPAGKTITVKNQTYGWGIWTDSARNAVLKAYENGTKTVDGKDHIYGKGYTTVGLGYGKSNHGLGNSYVAVSLNAQELWVVRNGKTAVHLTDVVTGTKNGSSTKDSDATPTGVWYIHYKQRNATLTGTNDDGSAYSSAVSYWMPFTLSGCGLHDASWRTDWSSTAYLEGGSHGCVNIRPSEIRSVWNAVKVHMPVIIYN